MSDSSINNRVETALTAIVEAGYSANKKGIAYELGYSAAYISEILKGRMKVGSDFVQKLFNRYNVNPNYLFGLSDAIFFNSDDYKLNNIVNTPIAKEENNNSSDTKRSDNLHPKTNKKLHPTLHPTTSLGLPKVVTVGESDKELISLVPNKAAAGYLNGYGDPEYVESLPTIRMPNLGDGTHRAFEIKGHSMSPTMHNSSISIGRWVECMDDIRDGRIYIVVTQSEGIVVKRVLNRVNESGKLILISDNQNKREYPNILLNADDVLEIWYQRANLAFEFPEPDIIYNRVNDLEARMTLFEDKIKHLLK